MFIIDKAKRWAKSSVNQDKNELEVYQTFKNEFEAIKRYQEEYIKEMGYEDTRLHVNYNGNLVPISLLQSLKESMLRNRNLDPVKRAKEATVLEELYRKKLEELEAKIISLALTNPNNVYLSKIASSLGIINTLLKRYLNLLAIGRSGLTSIRNEADLKKLSDNISIRCSEIETRITIDTMKR